MLRKRDWTSIRRLKIVMIRKRIILITENSLKFCTFKNNAHSIISQMFNRESLNGQIKFNGSN